MTNRQLLAFYALLFALLGAGALQLRSRARAFFGPAPRWSLRIGPTFTTRSVVAVGDVDGDGFGELLVGSAAEECAARVWSPSKDRTRDLVPPNWRGAPSPCYVALGEDRDGDGLREHVVARSDGAGAWMFDAASGALVAALPAGTGGDQEELRLDFDGDGQDDEVVCEPLCFDKAEGIVGDLLEQRSGGRVSVTAAGKGTLLDLRTRATFPGIVALGDLDGEDGDELAVGDVDSLGIYALDPDVAERRAR